MISFYIFLFAAIFSISFMITPPSIFATTNTTSTQWTNYTSEKYGISLQVPADWVIEEKKTHFIINNPNNEMNYLLVDPNVGPKVNYKLHESGLYYAALSDYNYWKNVDVPVSGIELTKLNGFDIATYEIIFDFTNIGSEIVSGKIMLIDINTKAVKLDYSNTQDDFNSIQSQQIMNKMINSIKFLD